MCILSPIISKDIKPLSFYFTLIYAKWHTEHIIRDGACASDQLIKSYVKMYVIYYKSAAILENGRQKV